MTKFMTCEECGSAEDVSDDEARCPGCGTAYAEATQASEPVDRETLQTTFYPKSVLVVIERLS